MIQIPLQGGQIEIAPMEDGAKMIVITVPVQFLVPVNSEAGRQIATELTGGIVTANLGDLPK